MQEEEMPSQQRAKQDTRPLVSLSHSNATAAKNDASPSQKTLAERIEAMPPEIQEMVLTQNTEDLILLVERFLVRMVDNTVAERTGVTVLNREDMRDLLSAMRISKGMLVVASRGYSQAVRTGRMGYYVDIVNNDNYGRPWSLQDSAQYLGTRHNHLSPQILASLPFAGGQSVKRISTVCPITIVDIRARQDDFDIDVTGRDVIYGDSYEDDDPEAHILMEVDVAADRQGIFYATFRWIPLASDPPMRAERLFQTRTLADGSTESLQPNIEEFETFAPQMQAAHETFIKSRIPIILPPGCVITQERLVDFQTMILDAVDSAGKISRRFTTRYVEESIDFYRDGRFGHQRWDVQVIQIERRDGDPDPVEEYQNQKGGDGEHEHLSRDDYGIEEGEASSEDGNTSSASEGDAENRDGR